MAKTENKQEAGPVVSSSPDPSAPQVLQIPMADFEAMIARIMAASGGGSPDRDAMVEALRSSVKATELLGEEFKRNIRRSNADHRHQSVFNIDVRCDLCQRGEIHPETGHYGHPKPKLIHETFFCFGKQFEDSLTPTEIELFNAFTDSTECRDGDWTATLERHSSKKMRLHVKVPAKTIDDLSALPSLDAILMELLYGRKVVDPVLAMSRITDLEDKLRAMEARLATANAADDAARAAERAQVANRPSAGH